MNLIHTLNRLLPQSQCRECGYDGCEPYAAALAAGQAAVNLCAPGGSTVMHELAALLGRPPVPPAKPQSRALALIDENVCIGCTACIRACPVDAIFGATKQMHTVIADECTGCGLCLPPCPVDCIAMIPTDEAVLPRHRFLDNGESENRFQAAAHAQNRFRQRNRRLQAAAARRRQPAAAATPALNPAALIAQAMAKAQTQQNHIKQSANHQQFRERQLQEARDKAAYRRAQRDLRYGNEAERAAALIWLQQHKAQQENG